MSSLLQIGYSGLQAMQMALSTSGQNVANVNTPGYSRLTPNLHSLAAHGTLSAGGGVEVSNIERLSNDFQNQQLWRATSELGFHDIKQQYLTALEGLLDSEGSSISVGLDNFFAALSEAAATPDSIVLRQQVMNEAEQLGQRFNGLNGNIQAQVEALQGQRTAVVGQVDTMAANLADLNKRIVELESGSRDTATLRDHRDNLIKQLSEHLDIRVESRADGALNVSLANGQPLVVGSTSATMEIQRTDTGEQAMSLRLADTAFRLNGDDLGGALGALHDAEYGSLRPVQDDLHDMARQLTDEVNGLLASGYDLDGAAGESLFAYDPNSITGMLKTNALTPEQLAFSDAAGEVGNNGVLLELLDLKSTTISVAGSDVTLNDAYAGVVGRVASISRQNQSDLQSAQTVADEAQAQRDSVSAVNLDEEAINLMAYNQAYQANMKVISTADRLLQELMAMF